MRKVTRAQIRKIIWHPNRCWLSPARNRFQDRDERQYQGKWLLAHRIMYWLWYGAIPKGKHIGHIPNDCWHPPQCINPLHLQAQTPSSNIRAGFRAGLLGKRKLTAKQKQMIPRMARRGWHQKDIADHLGVTRTTVQRYLKNCGFRYRLRSR